MATLAKCVAKR